ncbi:MAG: ribosome recycling factor [Candidatus Marinimicrobia bacterium]|nr:ribosome recycling factor [Candidatus Neomarinimicrobiota bacterium]
MLEDIYKDVEERMNKSVEATKHHFASVRTGRATPALLDNLKVDYYGTPTPLVQLAGISTPEPRLLTVQAYDKTAIPDIEKAISKSDLGLTPVNDGTLIRISIPPLTEERRKELVKVIHKMGEEGRVAMRNIRKDANHHIDTLKEDGHISEDDIKIAHDNVQDDTNNFIKLIDKAVQVKEKEIMED